MKCSGSLNIHARHDGGPIVMTAFISSSSGPAPTHSEPWHLRGGRGQRPATSSRNQPLTSSNAVTGWCRAGWLRAARRGRVRLTVRIRAESSTVFSGRVTYRSDLAPAALEGGGALIEIDRTIDPLHTCLGRDRVSLGYGLD